MTGAGMRDLFLLLADLDAENAMTALMRRPESLAIRPNAFDPAHDLLRYAGRDAGSCGDADNLLRPVQKTHRHAIVMFDREGSGRDSETAQAIEAAVERSLAASGWADRARAIVFDTELERWVWSRSPRVADCLGWESFDSLHRFLADRGFTSPSANKPRRPKEALDAALREKRLPRSARRFEALASEVGRLNDCADPAFRKLLSTLREWFPPAS